METPRQQVSFRETKARPPPQDFSERVCLKVALLGATFETGNHGVSALASGTITSLLHTFEEAEIQFLDYGREPVVSKARIGGRSVPIETVNLRFSKRPWQPNHVARLLVVAALTRLIPSPRLRSRWIFRNPWLRRICDSHLHLSIAGGDSFSDIYGIRRLLYNTLPQILVLLLNKPLVLLPQTYGPYKSRAARWIARHILRRAKLIYSRDQEGLKIVADLLGKPDGRIRFGYDMGFALEPLPPTADVLTRLDEIKRRGPVIGFNVSGLLYMGGYTRDNMFRLKANYRLLVQKILGCLISEHGCQVLLIPHVFGSEEKPESDVPACRSMVSEIGDRYNGQLHYLEGSFDQHEIKYIIGQCNFFLGSRMHACIAALSQCVPVVGLAYSRKFAGVLVSVGGGSRVVDLREAGEEQVLSSIAEAFQDMESHRQELEKRMPKVRESVLNFFCREEFRVVLATDTE
jgi:polysaccharide pyruvyl transferase WcaK-like protein